jgi:integrase
MKYMGLAGPNPCLVDRFPEKRQRRYVPPEDDFWKVFEVAEGQDRVMLLAYLDLAARKSELFQLKWDDVDFANGRVRLGTRKRSKGTLEYDWLPLTDDLFNAFFIHRQAATGEWFFLIRRQESLTSGGAHGCDPCARRPG